MRRAPLPPHDKPPLLCVPAPAAWPDTRPLRDWHFSPGRERGEKAPRRAAPLPPTKSALLFEYRRLRRGPTGDPRALGQGGEASTIRAGAMIQKPAPRCFNIKKDPLELISRPTPHSKDNFRMDPASKNISSDPANAKNTNSDAANAKNINMDPAGRRS